MNLPEKIILQIHCERSSDLSEIIVSLTVRAGTKNPYTIYFPKTDSNGETILSSEDFIGQFQDHWESGLMDFNGSISEASPDVIIELFDPVKMQSNLSVIEALPLLMHERKKWGSRSEMVSYFLGCRNASFEGKASTINLERQNRIIFHLTQRS